MEASESPPIYYFFLFYCLILVLHVAQFNKPYPWTLKKLTPEGQMERKNNQKNTRFRDSANFLRPPFFEVLFYVPNPVGLFQSLPLQNLWESIVYNSIWKEVWFHDKWRVKQISQNKTNLTGSYKI